MLPSLFITLVYVANIQTASEP